ncbi:hypothetical protein J6Q66_03540 [bacterium]|nr:hypothetical protein [bacterium]
MGARLTKFISKSVGVVALGCVGYDAYKKGCWKGKMTQKLVDADILERVHYNSMLLDNHTTVGANVKNSFDMWTIDTKIPTKIAKLRGFCSGFVSSLADNIVPFALATGALMFKKGLSKWCAIGLGLYAAKFFFTDMLGIGKPHYLTEKV